MPPRVLPPLSKETVSHKRVSTFRWVAASAIAPFALTVVLGGFGIYNETVAAADLPPGTPRCGMGMLAAMIIASIGGPIMGVAGGLAGFVTSKLWNFCRQERHFH